MTLADRAPSFRDRGSDSPRRWLVLLLLGTPFFVAVSDSTIVYTALPTIGAGLAFPPGSSQWVVSAYLLTTGGFLLLGGRAADLLGSRRVFLGGAAMFGGTSLLAGAAGSAAALIAARAAEGVSVAFMVPAALSILMATFPDGPDRNRALGIWGSLGGLGATAGLLLGGPITQTLGWRWVFLVNVPIAIMVVVVGPFLLAPHRRERTAAPLDVAGGVIGTAALLALVYAINDAATAGRLTARVVASLGLTAALTACFVRTERRAPAPLLPLRLLGSRTVVGGNLIVLAAGMSVDGLLLTFTILTQEVLGYSPVQFGLAAATMTLSSLVGVAVGQHLITRFGVRPVAGLGLALIVVASLVLSAATRDPTSTSIVLAGLAVFGPGMGAVFVAGQVAALAGIAPEDAGLASGIEETTFAVAGALGVALVSGVVLAYGASPAFLSTPVFATIGILAVAFVLPAGVGTQATDRSGGVDR
jgi:EmrB/QacA subfamily drug resistance transporter